LEKSLSGWCLGFILRLFWRAVRPQNLRGDMLHALRRFFYDPGCVVGYDKPPCGVGVPVEHAGLQEARDTKKGSKRFQESKEHAMMLKGAHTAAYVEIGLVPV